MLLYLDLNCFNRPFDDQSQDRIARETAAIFSVLQRIIDGIDHLSWSAILDFENAQHPLVDRRAEIARWAQRAMANVGISEQVSARAQALAEMGFGALDAAHVASAEAAACDCLLTCDNRLIRAARRVQLAVPSKTLCNIWRNKPMPDSLEDDALCAKGLAVLEDHLGPVEALRFLALISRQPFDYQHWRQQHFGEISLAEIFAQARAAKSQLQ